MEGFADFSNLPGHRVIDRSGAPLGSVEHVKADERSGRPSWLGVAIGATDSIRYVPVIGAGMVDGDVRIAFERRLVEQAPAADPQSSDAAAALYRHYGVKRRPEQGPLPAEGPPPDWP
jgi:sporulation protein YlmC with PRC-barrel domain